MQIANSYSAQPKQVASSSLNQTGTGTSVNSFESAMDNARDVGSSKKGTSVESDEEFPLESYALPSWYGSYIPEKSMLPTELNTAFWDLAKKLSADGIVTDEERKILNSFTENDPVFRAEQEIWSFREKYKRELHEYGEILNTYFTEALEENGVSSHREYYENVLLDEENSEKVHQSMQSRLESNPRALELMETLGATL